MTQAQVAITGNTYPVKDALKALGGRWNADRKAWMVPADKADEARKLVEGAPAKSSSSSSGDRSSKRRYFANCADCGARSQGYYRCRDCNLERREGGSRHKGGQSYYTRSGQFVLGEDD
jgi:hypothetical protein